ncbi:flagellar hook protein FlgE [Vibrio astriarenae]|nr:flagellar hook protein FlgE [Vibrio sp. C7]
MALTGSGFFVLEDTKGQTLYTRSGMFNIDSDGVINASNGAAIQGYSVDGDNNLLLGAVSTIQVSTASLQAKETDAIEFVANLDARQAQPSVTPFDSQNADTYNHSYTTSVFDSLGNNHTVSQYFVKTANPNEWQVYATVDGSLADLDGNGVSDVTADFNTVQFNSDGTLNLGGNYSVPISLSPSANDMAIDVNLTNVTQFGSDFIVSRNSPNGFTSGDYASVRVEMMAVFCNLHQRPISVAGTSCSGKLCFSSEPHSNQRHGLVTEFCLWYTCTRNGWNRGVR